MSAKKPPAEKIGSIPPFGLRMLPQLRDRVERAARENGRSLNAEIIARLEGSFENDELIPRLGVAISGLEHDLADEATEFKRFAAFVRTQMAAFSSLADIISETNGAVPADVVDAMKQIVAARRSKAPKP